MLHIHVIQYYQEIKANTNYWSVARWMHLKYIELNERIYIQMVVYVVSIYMKFLKTQTYKGQKID